MATEPTQDLTLVLLAQVTGETPQLRIGTIPIPPDYDREDRKNFFGFSLTTALGFLLENAGWRFPLRRALLVNASRMWLIEQLIQADHSALADDIRGIIEKADQEAVDEANLPPED